MIQWNKSMATTLHAHVDDDDVLIIEFDHCDRPVNTFTPRALEELDEVIRAVEWCEVRPRGVIFCSAKADTFIAGADLFALREMDELQIEQFLELGQGLFDRIAKLSIPTVAAINGQTWGGGLELALACDYRVAADRGSINIGLPEIKLGIIPGWGGTVRLPRMIGLRRALPMLLTGRVVAPRKARSLGIIDEVVRPEALRAAAHRLIRKQRPRRRLNRIDRILAASPRLCQYVLNRAQREAAAQTGNYPAADRLLETVRISYREGFAAGLKAERAAVLALATTDVCRNLMRLFFLKQNSKRAVRQSVTAEPVPVQHAAVIGGGTMGRGIVHALVKAEIAVRLIEVDEDAAAAGLGRVRQLLDGDVRAKRLSKLEADHAMRRVSPCTDWSGLRLADLVVEAIVEKLDVKREVFARLESLTRPDCVLASNTSSLHVRDIAAGLQHGERVIGLHFFNPVAKMPLVEVIRTDVSSDVALASAAAVVQQIGKVPIIVGDGPGFVVNRMLMPYLAEALAMAGEGVAIVEVDRAMRRWGMPMGPFELLDQVGLDVVIHIFNEVGPQLREDMPVPNNLGEILGTGHFGKKTGRGFYIYGKRKGRRPRVNETLLALLRKPLRLTNETVNLSDAAMQDRLVLPMINEAARLLGEGVIASTDLLDLATVLGLGLAPFRGGLVQHAHTLGLEHVIARMDHLAGELGDRFAPTAALRRVAETGGAMQDLVPDTDGSTSVAQPDPASKTNITNN